MELRHIYSKMESSKLFLTSDLLCAISLVYLKSYCGCVQNPLSLIVSCSPWSPAALCRAGAAQPVLPQRQAPSDVYQQLGKGNTFPLPSHITE